MKLADYRVQEKEHEEKLWIVICGPRRKSLYFCHSV